MKLYFTNLPISGDIYYGDRGKMDSQSQLAKDIEASYDEEQMVGTEAIKLRRKYPTLQKTWNRYKTVWHLVNEE